MTTGSRRDAFRRYPALGFLAAAAGLALLLPSGLTVPSSGPSSLAELAPVPGEGEGTGDLSELGEASSSRLGVGAGDRRRRAGTPPGAIGGPDQHRPRLKRCVGSPPRQTEDPLSPPCVAFFEGDNGGATWRGVGSDEITVVAYFRRTNSSVTGEASPPAGTLVDYAEPVSDDDFQRDRAMKVYARYFNERYQTYGRYVHLYGYYTVPFTDANVIERRRADAQFVDDELRPFATVPFADPIGPYVEATIDRRILNVVYDGFERSLYSRSAPLLWGYLPDLTDEAAIVADHICRKVARRPARFSGDPSDVGRERRFGIAYTESPREPEYERLKDTLVAELDRRCGVEVVAQAGASEVFEQGQQQAPGGIASFRSEGVTSVIVVAASNTALNFTSSASAVGWHPEWIVPGRRRREGLDQGAAAKFMPQDQWRHAFGISFAVRWGDEAEMHWHRSFRETCPECPMEEPFFTSLLYDPLAMLFHGIQAAGPRLTPASFDKGMHAIPERPSPNAYTPAAYFPSGSYTYVKDAMQIWWDPAGQAPGDSSPGCYRIPEDGKRYRAGEWRSGDDELFRDGPCNGHAPVS